jgi:hypothetical protein
MTMYTQTARFDTGRALTEDEMHRMAPSIFATSAHESRSERFRPIPTIEIVRGLAKEGFSVVGARQSVTRIPDKAPFTKHLLRIRKLDSTHKVGDTVMEMLLKNANDGTAAYDLMAGLFRICCLNSLVAQKDTIDTLKVRHSGDVMGKVIEGTYRVMTAAESVMAAPQDWGQMNLAYDDRPSTVRPTELLSRRRSEDLRNDLWTTFNVVQENALKGGLRGVSVNAETGVRRRQTTRAVTGIDQDVRLNKALWLLGERMAELKSVH